MAWDRGPTEKNIDRFSVVISRHWDNPKISITVNQDKIEMVCTLDDFVSALSKEMSSPLFMVTMTRQHANVRKAMINALEKIKEASAKVM